MIDKDLAGLPQIGQPKSKFQTIRDTDGSLVKLDFVIAAMLGPVALASIENIVLTAMIERDKAMAGYMAVHEVLEQNKFHIKKKKAAMDFSVAEVLACLREEVDELTEAYERGQKGPMLKEVADVQALLYQFILREGFTVNEVAQAVAEKMAERFIAGAPIEADGN